MRHKTDPQKLAALLSIATLCFAALSAVYMLVYPSDSKISAGEIVSIGIAGMLFFVLFGLPEDSE